MLLLFPLYIHGNKPTERQSAQGMESESEVKSLSCVRLFATPWTVAYQAPPFMGFSRQEYCSGLPFPSPGNLPDERLNPGLLHCRQTL